MGRTRGASCRSGRATADVLGEKARTRCQESAAASGWKERHWSLKKVLGSRVDLQDVRTPAAISSVSSTLAALVVKSLSGHDPTTGHIRAIAFRGLGAAP